MNSSVYYIELPRITSNTNSLRTIIIDWLSREQQLIFSISSPIPNENGITGELEIRSLKQRGTNCWKKLNKIVGRSISINPKNPVDWQQIVNDIQSLGKQMFANLFPHRIQELIRSWDENLYVVLDLNVPSEGKYSPQWIPWEIMYDGANFLGQKFNIVRNPRVPDEIIPSDIIDSKSLEILSIKQIINVVGGNIPRIDRDRASKLFNNFSPNINLLNQPTKEDFLETLSHQTPDILHFTCHGKWQSTPAYIQISNDNNPSFNLCLETMRSPKISFQRGYFVYMNVCGSAMPIARDGRNISSFVWEFYQKGATGVIGTLGSIPIVYSIELAEAFYQQIFNRPESLSSALQNARSHFYNDPSFHNIFWLLYCIYCDPQIL